MRAVGVIAAASMVLWLAACGGTDTRTVTVTGTAASDGGVQAPEQVLYGHIASLERSGDAYQLAFDPAWFLAGETANRAAAEDGLVSPGEPVPNDHYVVDEGHRLLHYRVAGDATVTVLTRNGDPGTIGGTPISVAELVKVVDGTSTLDLFEPLDSGVWITVDIDTVRAVQQQYQP
jgi:hypothetical protein